MWERSNSTRYIPLLHHFVLYFLFACAEPEPQAQAQNFHQPEVVQQHQAPNPNGGPNEPHDHDHPHQGQQQEDFDEQLWINFEQAMQQAMQQANEGQEQQSHNRHMHDEQHAHDGAENFPPPNNDDPPQENDPPFIEPIPIALQPVDNNKEYKSFYLGKMDLECPSCHALHWAAERLHGSSLINPKFGTCCKSGKVKLPMLKKPPPELQRLYDGTDNNSSHFLENICSYNASAKPVPSQYIYFVSGARIVIPEISRDLWRCLEEFDSFLTAVRVLETNQVLLMQLLLLLLYPWV